ncbi:MAG: T9SS type A sorting domain-containing protein [Salibacteraceae bacterium]
MIRLALIITISFVSTLIQAQKHQWVKNFGSITNAKYEGGTSIWVGDSGNIFTTGWFRDTADFDPGSGQDLHSSSHRNDNDVFIHKMDSSGNLIWAKTLKGDGDDTGFIIRTDSDGNVIIGGRFKDTTDFDPGVGTHNLVSNGRFDFFVLKLNSSGQFMWANSFGNVKDETLTNIMVDDSNNIYCTGQYYDMLDIDPSASTFMLGSASIYGAIFYSKFSSAGQLTWAKSIADATCSSSTLDSNNNIILTGTIIWAATDFDPSSGTFHLNPTPNRFYIAKYANNGNFIWAKNIGGNPSSFVGTTTQIDQEGNIVMVGQFTGTIDVDPDTGITNITSKGGADIFVVKLNASGNFLWAHGFGSTQHDYERGVKLDKNGFVHILGVVTDIADMDPGPGVANVGVANIYNDPFTLKLNPNGDFVWVYSLPNLGPEATNDIAFGASGTIFTTGNFRDSLDFDPDTAVRDMRYKANGQIFVQKLLGCSASYDSISAVGCGSYTSPSNTKTWRNSGVYSDTLINASGCDSILKINLVINNSYTTPLSVNSCNSYLSPSGKFTWTISGNYKDTLTSLTGCDSILVISLQINSPSSSLITDTSCFNYTSPSGKVWSVSGSYFDTIPNYLGCDSNIQIDLHIDTVVINVTVQSDTLKSLAGSNSTFQWLDCDSSYSLIPNETFSYFTPKTSGNYAVEINSNGCVDTSNCQSITTSIFNFRSNKSSMKVYPNPAQSILTVKLSNSQIFSSIKLISSVGKIVYLQNFTSSNSKTFDIDLPSGIYIIVVSDKNKISERRRVIIE